MYRYVQQSTPENWATTEVLSMIFTELLHTTEFSSTTVFSHTPENSYTVRPRDTRPQAARTLTVHNFELGSKILEKHVF